MTVHLVIPDCQVKSGQDFEFLRCIGNFIVKKQPDVIVNIGDFADMESLSSYDFGKKSFEGRRYISDVEASHEAMATLLGPLDDFNLQARKNKHKQYTPRMVLTYGNHEQRIVKAVDNDAKMEGMLSLEDLKYEAYGWEVYPFLEVVVIDGVAYSHYFVTGQAGRPASTAQVQLNKMHMSSIAGHQQGLQIAMGRRADGKSITSIIAGSCYEHEETYLGPQGNKHWSGVLMLHEVEDGAFDPMFVSLKYLKSKYL